jgi:hypothetical protein
MARDPIDDSEGAPDVAIVAGSDEQVRHRSWRRKSRSGEMSCLTVSRYAL